MKLKVDGRIMERGKYVCLLLSGARCSLLRGNDGKGQKESGEVILINLEEAQKIGTLENLLQEAGFDENQGIFSIKKRTDWFFPNRSRHIMTSGIKPTDYQTPG